VLVADYHAHDLKPCTAIDYGKIFGFLKMHLIIGHHFKPAHAGRTSCELVAGRLARGLPNVGALQTVELGV